MIYFCWPFHWLSQTFSLILCLKENLCSTPRVFFSKHDCTLLNLRNMHWYTLKIYISVLNIVSEKWNLSFHLIRFDSYKDGVQEMPPQILGLSISKNNRGRRVTFIDPWSFYLLLVPDEIKSLSLRTYWQRRVLTQAVLRASQTIPHHPQITLFVQWYFSMTVYSSSKQSIKI